MQGKIFICFKTIDEKLVSSASETKRRQTTLPHSEFSTLILLSNSSLQKFDAWLVSYPQSLKNIQNEGKH